MIKVFKKSIISMVLILTVFMQIMPISGINVYAAGSDAVKFLDDQLEQAVRYELNKQTGDITRDDMLKLKKLNKSVSNIKNLTGLEYALNLESINFTTNQISDLRPIANLTKLTSLMLPANNIVDITPLSGLSNLENIDLRDNKIVDISPLSALTKLTNLSLANNKINSVDSLDKLSKLSELDLSNNDIKDITSLSNLSSLKNLTLFDNKVVSLDPIKNLPKLESLSLAHNKISDISAINGLTNLKTLYIDNNEVTDIAVLNDLTSLVELNVSNNKVSDIAALKDKFSNLKIFYANNNEIANLPVFKSAKSLEQLGLSGNKLSNIESIGNFASLKFLDISSNKITDIRPIMPLASNKMFGLYLQKNNINVEDANTRKVMDAFNKSNIPYVIMPQSVNGESYKVSITMNPLLAGIVTGEGTYEKDGLVEVTAEANDGYQFINWTVNNEVVSTDKEYSFIAVEDVNLVANFNKEEVNPTTYNVETSVYPLNTGKTKGAGTYEKDSQVTLTAIANEGYQFVNWTTNNEVISSDKEYSFIAVKDVSVIANFEKKEVEPTLYKVEASAYPLSAGKTKGTGTYEKDSQVTLTAIANEGYKFANWTINNRVVSTDKEYSFIAVEDKRIVANFTEEEKDEDTVKEQYYVNVGLAQDFYYAGDITGAGYYEDGEKATVTAEAYYGYKFKNWTVEGKVVSEDAEYTFTVNDDISLQANFVEDSNHDDDYVAKEQYYIGLQANIDYVGNIYGEGYYEEDSKATVTAEAYYGYKFENWTVNGKIVSTDAEYTFEITDDTFLQANFTKVEDDHDEEYVAKEQYYVGVLLGSYEEGHGTGEGYYEEGDKVTVIAEAYYGYRFKNWTVDGKVVSTDTEYTFDITDDIELTPNFVKED